MVRTARRGADGRRDGNQKPIVDALRAAGVDVVTISKAGIPDLLTAHNGRTVLLEVKNKGGKLTDDQRTFLSAWQGEAYVVFTPAEALAVFGIEVTE